MKDRLTVIWQANLVLNMRSHRGRTFPYLLVGFSTIILTIFVHFALSTPNVRSPGLPPEQKGPLFILFCCILMLSHMSFRIGTKTMIMPETYSLFALSGSDRFGLSFLGTAIDIRATILWIPSLLILMRAFRSSLFSGLMTWVHLVLLILLTHFIVHFLFICFAPWTRKHPGNFQAIPSFLLVALLLAIQLDILGEAYTISPNGAVFSFPHSDFFSLEHGILIREGLIVFLCMLIWVLGSRAVHRVLSRV